ncbi:MAG: glycosyltransferase [Candidatus Micrarchaeia archaeon]
MANNGDYKDLTLIIPTFNEVENVDKIALLITGAYKGARILFADDGSTDGTRELVRKLSRKHHCISLLDRSSSRVHGLTISVISAAMQVSTSKIVVMDADMQHPVSKVRHIYKKLDSYDIVVGVRTRVKSWGLHRRVMSKGMAYIAYAVLKLRRKPVCNDMMSGFFGIRTRLFKRIIREHADSYAGTGYKVLLDTLRLAGKGVTIGEVPYATFHNRSSGNSKFKPKIMLDTLKSVFR